MGGNAGGRSNELAKRRDSGKEEGVSSMKSLPKHKALALTYKTNDVVCFCRILGTTKD